MSWKDDLQLKDLEPEQTLEFTCKSCGHVFHRTASELQSKPELEHAWLNEVEEYFSCKSKECNDAVRLSIYHDSDNSGFIGGLA